VVKIEGLAKLAKPKLSICDDNCRPVVKEGGITCNGFVWLRIAKSAEQLCIE
jgi:hypothetical protein